MQEVVHGPFLLKTKGFEGSLDLLLTLIERRTLSVSDVALARVADEYIAHVKTLTHVPIDEVAQFVLTASTLLLIKSRSLLPVLDLTHEEEGDIRDLEERLRRLEIIRERAHELASLAGGQVLYARRERVGLRVVFAPGQRLTAAVITKTIQELLSAMSAEEVPRVPEAVVRRALRLEQTMRDLAERIERTSLVRFSDIRAASADRFSLIVSFLALLELVRRGAAVAVQEVVYADITIEGQQVGVPRYD